MDSVTVAALLDELQKIAANTATLAALPGMPKPPSLTQAPKATNTLKPQTKMQDYTAVHSQGSVAATGTANAAKATPPPPVVA